MVADQHHRAVGAGERTHAIAGVRHHQAIVHGLAGARHDVIGESGGQIEDLLRISHQRAETDGARQRLTRLQPPTQQTQTRQRQRGGAGTFQHRAAGQR
jgi:hypothetical protein